MRETAIIRIEYSDGCFCKRPDFIPVLTDYNPRFLWADGVKRSAELNGIGEVQHSKREKRANGFLPFKCQHRDKQLIRFAWSME